MTKDKNLAIFSEVEKFALYGAPDFNPLLNESKKSGVKHRQWHSVKKE